MDNFFLSAIVKELTNEVEGRAVARVSVSASTIQIDLRLAARRQLLASLDRSMPALYIAGKAEREPVTAKRTSTSFQSLLRKHIVESRLVNLRKHPRDRIVQLDFEKLDPGDNKVQQSLRLELTGRSANAYLTDGHGSVIGSLFENAVTQVTPLSAHLEGSDPAGLAQDSLMDSATQPELLERYFSAGSPFGPQLRNEFLARCGDASPSLAFRSLLDALIERQPLPLIYSRVPLELLDQQVINLKTDILLSHFELVQASAMLRYEFETLSEAAGQYYDARSRAAALAAEFAAMKHLLVREVHRREKAINAIEADRIRFQHPERLKEYGDLILANLASARIEERVVTVVDYYDSNQSQIQIAIPDGATLQEAASSYFAQYQKARRALAAIASRERAVSRDLEPLQKLLLRLEKEPTADSLRAVEKATEQLLGKTAAGLTRDSRNKGSGVQSFGRRFRSSEGYEIAVGRNDRENDALTFRVARPNDIWLHAADYPGSHVIIRNPTRNATPHRTITEAAELAAFYSQAKREGKAAVHYTQKKFISKPPRSKPGLVRISSFKTILVEPRGDLERLN
ncbi:MAG: NFACT family protein [Blastocatellia bacterium]